MFWHIFIFQKPLEPQMYVLKMLIYSKDPIEVSKVV